MACKLNEVAILKAQAVKLDDDTMMLLMYMYHTAEKEARHNGTDKSFYRYEGRVMKISDFKREIDSLKADDNCMNIWRWPTPAEDWNKEWFLGYYFDNTNKVGAKWYQHRLNKMINWETFIRLARDGVRMTAKGPKTYPSAHYDLDGYVTTDGETFNIDSPETMLKFVGKFFTKKIQLKREISK